MCDPIPKEYITHGAGIVATLFPTDTHINFKGKQNLFISQPFKPYHAKGYSWLVANYAKRDYSHD